MGLFSGLDSARKSATSSLDSARVSTGGLGELLLGKEGSISTQVLETLTPEQKALMDQLLSQGKIDPGAVRDVGDPAIVSASGIDAVTVEAPDAIAGGTAVAGEVAPIEKATTIEATPVQQAQALNISAPEQLLAATIGGPQQEAATGTVDREALGLEGLRQDIAGLSTGDAANLLRSIPDDILSPEAKEEFIRTNIRDPLAKEAQEATRLIGRQFGQGGFFSSDRERQDEGIQTAFADAEARELAKLALDLRGQDINARLGAAQGLAGIESTGIQAGLGVGQLALGAETAELGAGTDVALANLGARTQTDIAELGVESEANLATLGATTDIAQARLAAGTQTELANLQAETQTNLANLAAGTQTELANLGETGQSQRLAAQLETQTNLANLNALIDTQKTNLEAGLRVSLTNGDFEQSAAIQNALNELNASQFNVSSGLQADVTGIQRDVSAANLELQTEQLLQSLLGVQAFENVVSVIQPTSGAAGGIAAGLGAAAGGGFFG